MSKAPLIIVAGPTAVGKTALSLELAERLGGEIISADSMQVYRHMDIGTAKIDRQAMRGIPHHLIDILEPSEDFSVAIFQKMAKECINAMARRGKIPIVTGGTGFYIQALLYDIDFSAAAGPDVRAELEALARENGSAHLHRMLAAKDPVAAAAIHENNRKRIIRALEYYQQTGTPISRHNEAERQRSSPYDFRYFVLHDERRRNYAEIERRVDRMIESGLVDEVKTLRGMGLGRDMVSMQGLGYKEILAYLDGEMALDEAINLIKRNTRRFAKRQLTWFRREREVIWLYKPDFAADGAIVDTMLGEVGNAK